MRRVIQVVLVSFALGMVLFALTRSNDANASALYTSPYSFEQTYGTAFRFIRVDMGFRVLEKDKDAGYILFDYTSPESGNKAVPGSLEIVETPKGIHITAQIPAMPQYHEQMLVDLLAKKLETEHGRPMERKDRDKDKPKDKEEQKPGEDQKIVDLPAPSAG